MIRLTAMICSLAGTCAADLCDDLEEVRMTGAGQMLDGANCSYVVTLGVGPEQVCYWEHGFRSPSARTQFEGLVTELSACLDSSPPDQSVNHPDSYDLRQFGDPTSVSVSLKDKGALAQTLVFLRIVQP